MKSAIKGFLTVTNLKILRVINLTPKAHNGIRRKKIKKV
jgi:ribosomal protein S11